MTVKKVIYIFALAALLILAGVGCASQQGPSEDEPLIQLTLEELSEYDGKDGSPAYIAVDGVIYDVTDVPQWSGGEHNGYSAGQDLTDAIKNESPHGVSRLRTVPVIGEIVE